MCSKTCSAKVSVLMIDKRKKKEAGVGMITRHFAKEWLKLIDELTNAHDREAGVCSSYVVASIHELCASEKVFLFSSFNVFLAFDQEPNYLCC